MLCVHHGKKLYIDEHSSIVHKCKSNCVHHGKKLYIDEHSGIVHKCKSNCVHQGKKLYIYEHTLVLYTNVNQIVCIMAKSRKRNLFSGIGFLVKVLSNQQWSGFQG